MSEYNIPTEQVELPSKGLLYPKDHPLSSGKIEMKYMTAREEDILTNPNFIQQGTVLDKLIKSLIVTQFDYGDLLECDKDALLIASRVLAYGKDYTFTFAGQEHTIDLSLLEPYPLDESLYTQGENEFEVELPAIKKLITFKLLTHKDMQDIEQERKGMQKLKKDYYGDVTIRLKHLITSIDGNRDVKEIRNFVDKGLLASDARVLRKKYEQVVPKLNTTFVYTDEQGAEQEAAIPIGVTFLWPDA